MRHKHFFRSLLALLVLLIGSLDVHAADDVVQQIPDNALAYVVVKNMQQASREVSQTAQRMQLPAPDLLQLAKERLNLVKGVVDTGDMALVLAGGEADSPFPVIFVRTNNYEELLDQLNPDAQEGPISRVTMNGEPMCMAKKGEYAVFVPSMFCDGLKQVVESEESVKIDDQMHAFAQKADAYAVITNSGVKMLSQKALDAIEMVKQQFSQAGPQGEMVVAAFVFYEELLKWASEGVTQVVLTLQIADNGAVSLTKRVGFQDPVEYTTGGPTVGATKRLAHLPKWPYVMAFAGEIGDSKAMEKWMRLSMDMMRVMAGPQQLTDEQIERMIEASRTSLEGLRGMAFTFGVPKPAGSIYTRMGMIMEVDNAKAYLNNYLQSTQQMQEIFADNEQMPYRILTAESVQVADVKGMKVVMQILPAAFGPGGEQAKQMFDKLYGEGGKIEMYAAPVDAKRIALAYVSEESLREVIQAAKSGKEGLATDEGVQTTARLLSDDAQLVGYISPKGMLQFAGHVMETLLPQEQQANIPRIPPFPASPPLGFSLQYDGQALEAELVAPAASLTALGQYIQAVRQAAAR